MRQRVHSAAGPLVAVFMSVVASHALASYGPATHRPKAVCDNPLGGNLIPFRKVCEAPDPRFNDPAHNRFVDKNGVLRAEHRARCEIHHLPGENAQACIEDTQLAMQFGCINEVEGRWAQWAGLYVICYPRNPDQVFAACPCSCFAPEVRLLVTQPSSTMPQWVRADQVTPEFAVITLGDSSTVEKPVFEARDILYTTSGPELPDLVRIALSTGAVLRLTQHHAVLLSDGRMVTAKDLTTADELVNLQGQAVAIQSVRSDAWGGDVYNLAAAGSPKTSHIIAAEGVLVGDLLWQNSLGSELGEIAIHSNINKKEL